MHGEITNKWPGCEEGGLFVSHPERVCDAACHRLIAKLGFNENITNPNHMFEDVLGALTSTNMNVRDMAICRMKEWFREVKPLVTSNMWSLTKETEKLVTNRNISRFPRRMRIPALLSAEKMETLKRKTRDGCKLSQPFVTVAAAVRATWQVGDYWTVKKTAIIDHGGMCRGPEHTNTYCMFFDYTVVAKTNVGVECCFVLEKWPRSSTPSIH